MRSSRLHPVVRTSGGASCHAVLQFALGLVLALTAGTITLSSQNATTARKRYEVASIKSNTTTSPYQISIGAMPGGRFMAVNTTLRLVLRQAFRPLQDSQIVGGPDWINNDRFDIDAKPEGSLAPEEVAGALQVLLEERFELKAHREKRELPVYLLTVVKSGTKLKAVDPPPPVIGPNGVSVPGSGAVRIGRGSLETTSSPMSQLANYLSPQVGRPVIDRTGLTAFYNFDLQFTPQTTGGALGPPTAEPSTPDPAHPTVFTALEEQLGLKLEAGKAAVDVLVVDSVQKPSTN